MAEETGITVLRGLPDAAELAAVTTVLLAVLRERARQADPPDGANPPVVYADWSVKGTGGQVPAAWSARQTRRKGGLR
ncbi:acyl-CoA carboxylase subunit epsilon [Streptomyces sp. SCSIO 30461]|uniref:acyl-CoA carboxylase subunit epsilon n=1 Tax=Streptomyces sp. SCSIO 30461 TaxID=3118085 RepID=UPI0030D39F70